MSSDKVTLKFPVLSAETEAELLQMTTSHTDERISGVCSPLSKLAGFLKR
jgi:hypothetical protein